MGKRQQLRLEINTTFIGNSKDLVKQIESDLGQVNLGKVLSNRTSGLTKTLQAQLNELEKQLNKPGRTTNEYSRIFSDSNTSIQETLKSLKTLKQEFRKLYDAQSNKDNLAQLDKLKQKYQELIKLSGKQKAEEKYLENSANKLQKATGSTYAGPNITQFKDINRKYKESGNDANFTKKQKELLGIYDAQGKILQGQEGTLKKIITYIDQVLEHTNNLENIGIETKNITGNTSNPAVGAKGVGKSIEEQAMLTITEDNLRASEMGIDGITGKVKLLNKELSVGPDKISDADKKAQEMASTMGTLKDIASQFGIVWSAAHLARGFKDLINYSYEFYKSLDSALNQIYVVSNLSSEAVNDLTQNFVNMAERTGMAIDDVTTAAVLFYQQGLNTNEVLTMTEVTAQFAKVAGTDASDAADKLTAAINGYCLAAEDESLVADKFNKVAAASAADIDELSTAFSKAAAQANQAGVSMDNYLAYIATMEEATREAPENIGTSLKTIFSRMQQVKEAGTTEEGDVDINQVETALNSVGVALRDTKGELRDLEEVFAELGPKWQTLDRNTQAYIGTIVAGTRQQSRFITLMQNWDRVLELSEDSQNSAGMQALMHAKAMESVESKTQQLNVAWQEFISNLTNSETIKNIIELLTRLVKGISDGKAPITALMVAINLLAARLNKISTTFGDVGKSFGKFIKQTKASIKVFGSSVKNHQKMTKSIQDLKEEQEDYTKRLEDEENNYASLINQQSVYKDDMAALTKQINESGDASGALAQQQQQLQNDMNKNQVAIEQSKTDMQNYKTALDNTNTSLQAYGNMTANVANLSVGIIGVVTTLVSLFGDLDSTAGQTAVGIAAAAGFIATAIAVACGGIKVALDSVGIGIILSMITMAITAISSLINVINKDVEAEKKNSLNDAIESLASGLDELEAKSAGVRASERLIEEYNTLSKTLGRTAAQQDRLNTIIQELGDTYGIDVITDAYGDLSININEVNEALEAEKEALAELKEEMRETEIEAFKTAVEGGNSVDDYLNKMYSTYRSSYKSMILDLQDELGSGERAITDTTYASLNANLKNNLLARGRALSEGNITDWIDEQNEAIDEIFETNVSGQSGYEHMYDLIAELQSEVDNLTYDEVQGRMEEFFQEFGEQLNLSAEQWAVFADSINDTVFGNSSLNEFLSKLDEQIAKTDTEGSYWTDEDTGVLTLKEGDVKKALSTRIDLNDMAAKLNGMEYDTVVSQGNLDESIDKIKQLTKEGKSAKEIVKSLSHDEGWNANIYYPASNEGEDTLKEVEQTIEEYQDLYEDYLDRMKQFKIDYGLEDWSDEEVEELHSSMVSLRDTMGSLDAETASFLSNSQELLNFEGLQAGEYADITEVLNGMTKGLEQFETDAQRYAYLSENLLNEVLKENPNLSEEGKEKVQAMIDEWFSGLKVTADISWADFANEIKDIGTQLEKVDSIMEDLSDDGHITIDSFLQLGDVLTDLINHMTELGRMDQITEFANILSNLNVEYDENTHSLMVNGEAMEDLAQLETVLAKAKMISLKATIQSNLMQAQARKIALESEIQATKTMILWLQGQTQATVKGKDIQTQANTAMTNALQDDAGLMENVYRKMITDTGSWASASVAYIAQVDEALNKLGTGSVDWAYVQREIERIQEGVKWGGLEVGDIEEGKDYDVATLLGQYENYLDSLDNSLEKVNAEIEYYNSMLITIDSLLAADDLSGLFGDNAKEQIEAYIGQLEEIYNILRKIEGMEKRLSALDKYADLTRGEARADYLAERVELTGQLVEQNKELLRAQKYREQTEQNAIKKSSVGHVFDFDEFGNIIIDYEKYLALGDKDKELADKLYSEYEEVHNETLDYYDQLLDSIQDTIDAQQEMVDAYIDIENQVAEATKETYQKMLDNKLEAIDTEIEALDKLREARERANKAKDDSKDLSDMQTSLKRAMMDTSGASNTKVFDYQDQIRSKLEQMGEDEYTQRLDAITEGLEAQKEQLQRNFDEYFEDWTNFHNMIEERILTDPDSVYGVLTSTEDYLQASDAERREMMKEWENQYAYAMKGVNGKDGIAGVQESIKTLQDSIPKDIDKMLENNSQIKEIGTLLSRVILEIKNSGSGGNQSGSGKTTSSNNNNKTVNITTSNPDPWSNGGKSGTYTRKDLGVINNTINPDTKHGTFSTTDDFGIRYQPDNVGGKKLISTGAKAGQFAIHKNSSGVNIDNQTIWKTKDGGPYYVWNGTKGVYENTDDLIKSMYVFTKDINGVSYVLNDDDLMMIMYQANQKYGTKFKYKKGGMADFTGPAWLDGTKSAPEAVLNAEQTRAFLILANHFEEMIDGFGNNVVIESISFNVDSMSSVEDGEKAFDAFVNRFKEIGSQTGLSFNTTRL